MGLADLWALQYRYARSNSHPPIVVRMVILKLAPVNAVNRANQTIACDAMINVTSAAMSADMA